MSTYNAFKKSGESPQFSIGAKSGVGIIILYFIIIQLRFLQLDLWNDEVYTFKFFILKSYHTILTDYHVPNNHILLNLFYRLYLDVTGIHSLSAAMAHPFVLRLPQLAFAIVTLIYTYRCANLLFNQRSALLALMLLVTTVPYVNFAPQIRGYNLSMMLFSIVLFCSLQYLKSGNWKTWMLICFCTGLLMYTIPSNMYTVMSLGSFFGIALLLKVVRKHNAAPYPLKAYVGAILALIGGVLLSLLFYWPVLKHVFLNDYVSYLPFRFSNLLEYFPHVIHCFNSNRGIVFAIAIVVSIVFVKDMRGHAFAVLMLVYILLFPFLLIFVLGNNVPDRVFVTLTPIFAVCMSSFFEIFFKRWLPHLSAKLLGMFMISMYLVLNLNIELHHINRELLADINGDGRRQDLYYNYYLAHFRPEAEVSRISQDATLNKLPVFIIGCEPHDIPHYLEEHHLDFFADSVTISSALSQRQRILLVTNHPNRVPADSNYTIQKLSAENNYHTFFLLSNNMNAQ